MSHRIFILLPLICMLIACQPLRESQRTVAVADSLRMNEGRQYDDSLALAEAYSTLGRCRLVYPDDYARACYYYGRMLRQHNNQVAAMQAFISGTHAPYVQRVVPLLWFSDYHILGRIYSNMGTMCHLIDEFQLGYDMYERSAKSFHTAGDTTAYYYGLNAMALELAEQDLHDETFSILNHIEQNCTDSGVLIKLWETKTILYFNLELYDSTIYTANELYSRGYYAATGYIKEAQAYWYMEKYDSSLYYSHKVLSSSTVLDQDRYNMLYLISNYDTTLSVHTIQEIAAQRADIYHENINPLLQQLSVAIEILQQDIDAQPSKQIIILFLIILLLCVVIIGIGVINFKIAIKRQIDRNKRLKKENDDIRKSSEYIKQQYSAHQQQIIQDIENACELLRQHNDWDTKLHWRDYDALCDYINRHFYMLADKLQSFYKLDEKEVRLCILILLDMFNNNTLAKILHYGKGIRTYKSRLNTKLGNKGKNLRSKLIQIAALSSK